jgi:hypothetical protein
VRSWTTDVGEGVATTGVAVSVGAAVAVSVGVGVAVSVGAAVAVSVGVRVAVSVGVRVAVSVGVAVAVSVGVGVAVSVGVAVAVSVGVGVAVSVGVGVAVSTAAAQPAEPTLFVSIVTAPFRARALPDTFAPVVRLMLSRAKTLPTNSVSVPRVAELPTCQNTLQSDPPLITRTDELLAVVSVLFI